MAKRATLFVFSSVALLHGTIADLTCRPEGPVVPQPRNLNASQVFQQAGANLTASLDRAVRGEIKAGWIVENTSFSIGLISLDQASPSDPLWEYHHLSPANINGTKSISKDSQYLIGSISKVFSDAILLRSGLNLDDPITKYLPELDKPESLISWNNITLRALASQVSGIPPNYGFSEYYYIKEYFESLGFPHVEDGDFEPCGVIGLNSDCSKQQFLQGMLKVHPVSPPMDRPVYSNIAFGLFSYAVEVATGKNYSTQLHDLITVPFGLSSTTVSPGIDSRAVIPPVANSWGSDYGDNAPGGGLVSTLSDLSAFAHAILDHSLLPTPTMVREWLQPRSFAGSPYSFVGTPWEIFQPPADALTPAHPHTIAIYAKDGAAYGYRANLAVIPQYNVALVVLSAGDTKAATFLSDAMTTALVPAVDAAARDETLSTGYAGTFLSSACTSSSPAATSNSTSSSSSSGAGSCTNLTLSLDADSLQITHLTRNGSDILEALASIWSVTLGALLADIDPSFRIFPADVSTPGGGGAATTEVREDWRLWWAIELGTESDLAGVGLATKNCLRWSVADWLYYGSEPIDRIVFVRDADTGGVVGVELPFLRSGLLKRVADD